MKKSTRLLLLAILTALISSGCASVTKGPNQRVQISSMPEGAAVINNGRVIGTTPMSASLSRAQGHTITLERPNYYPETVTILTVPNEASERFIRFGIDEATGAYNDLSPSRVHVELDPRILPREISDEPFGELSSKILEVDDKLENGEISRAEHRYILSRLFDYYQP